MQCMPEKGMLINMKNMNLKNMNAKQKKKMHVITRAVIQLVFFLFFPSAFTAAFAGVKYIFTQLGAKEPIEMTSFLTVFLVLSLYSFVFGRFFCGFACAFGSFGDAVHVAYLKICKKLKKKPVQMKEPLGKKLNILKYLVLIVIVMLCYAGIYSKAQGYSPWDVFSMLHAGNFKLHKYVIGVILLLLIMIGMCIQERFFCRFLCPMGAVFAILPVLPIFSLRRKRENCIKGCRACTKKCTANLEIPEEGSMDVLGDCFQCQKCIDTCPKSNIHCGVEKVKGNEFIFTIVRALLLLFLFVWMGI